jgi:hypothetical protein
MDTGGPQIESRDAGGLQGLEYVVQSQQIVRAKLVGAFPSDKRVELIANPV